MIPKLMLVVLLLLPNLGWAGGQSTVIGRRADLYITFYAAYNPDYLNDWPSKLLQHINYSMLDRADSDPIYKEKLPPYPTFLLEDLIDALEEGDWYRALEIRYEISVLIEAEIPRHGGCRH